MKNVKQIWKQKASAKNTTRQDVLAYCILRAMVAKNEDKPIIAEYFVKRAFSRGAICAHRWHPYQAVKEAGSKVEFGMKWHKLILGVPLDSVFENDEEIEQFKTLLNHTVKGL